MRTLTHLTGALALAAALVATPALARADHFRPQPPPPPVLSSISLFHEHDGAHHPIGSELIPLNTAGTGANNHMTFEVRGADQWGRPLSAFEFHPVLVFPGGNQLAWIEALGNNHFRLWAGNCEVWNAPLTIRSLENPALCATLLVTLQHGWRTQSVHPHDSGYVPTYTPPVRVILPTSVAPTCAPPAPTPTRVVYPRQRRHHSPGFFFGLDSDGDFRFGFDLRDRH
ncbi:MAG: hypothetical protein HZA54_05400 [Planctomycetes bacterium]|nr:hypothetical protein [Planctomycetota bacterium]